MSEKISEQIASSEFLLAKEKQETLRQIENISEVLALEITKKFGFEDISLKDIRQAEKKVEL